MKRVIAIAITIVVFAAVILPTATVMASTLYFSESFEEEDLGVGAKGDVSGSYNTQTRYLSADMCVQPLSASHKVQMLIHVDLDADGNHDLGEPSVEYWIWGGTPGWEEPVEINYSEYIPAGAIVRYVVQSFYYFVEFVFCSWGAQWHLATEDFEWGYDRASLEGSPHLDWTVYGFWGSFAEIEANPNYVHSGTRSARINKGSFMVQASYAKVRPNYIGCYLMKEGSSFPSIWSGDGAHRVHVRITSWGAIQYYDDGGWQNTQSTIEIEPRTWYLIELRNIDWLDDFTYDIYIGRIRYGPPMESGIILSHVDWHLVESGVPMHTSNGHNGRIYYGDSAGRGSFWIDDIYDG